MPPAIASHMQRFGGVVPSGTNNLNINLPDNNAVLRLEVELRDKNPRRRPNNQMRNKGFGGGGGGGGGDRKRTTPSTAGAVGVRQAPSPSSSSSTNTNNFFVPMEKVSIFLIVILGSDFFYGNSIIYIFCCCCCSFGLSRISGEDWYQVMVTTLVYIYTLHFWYLFAYKMVQMSS